MNCGYGSLFGPSLGTKETDKFPIVNRAIISGIGRTSDTIARTDRLIRVTNAHKIRFGQ